ncbi:hypothetical protein FQN57_004398 [Myotisia sp. PD_48]|nr:hypothetical protein FQN57_004398 [Myotisia sp. PD_48]
MSERTALSDVPQHVAAQLAHLTSRPGVQSTLILSRKDGSIIQATGQLAAKPSTSNTEPTTSIETTPTSPAPDQESTPTEPNDNPSSGSKPYSPSPAETLAAHIHVFVSSALALSTTLSNPSMSKGGAREYEARNEIKSNDNARNASSNTDKSKDENDTLNREEDDDLKLLRLRTKIHEIIIIPDRKFLLCVVHDVSSGTSSTGAGAASHSR